jgi:hypothetical protein
MSSGEDRNREELDEVEMFKNLDDSDVVLGTLTIEKKTKISDFYHVNAMISYLLFAVFGRIGIFFFAEYVFGNFKKTDNGLGMIDLRDKAFIASLMLVSFIAYAAMLVLLARKNIAESYFRATGHEFPVFKAALVYFLPGELFYLAVSIMPQGMFRFGAYTSLSLYCMYELGYVLPNGREEDIFNYCNYIKEDYIEFFKIFGIYELICFAVFLTVLWLAYNRAFCRKMRATLYNKLEYAAVIFCVNSVLYPFIAWCANVHIERDIMPVLVLIELAFPFVYLHHRAKTSYYFTFVGYDSKEGMVQKLLRLIVPGEILRAVLTFVLYGQYRAARFGRIFAYPANALFNIVYGNFIGKISPVLDFAVFALCYILYVGVNFGIMYFIVKRSNPKIFKAYKEKLEEM